MKSRIRKETTPLSEEQLLDGLDFHTAHGEALAKPKYELGELLAECDEWAPFPEELKEWINAPAVGKEDL
jgi:hypothetical protein